MFNTVAKILLVFIPLLVLACTDEPSEQDSPPPGGIAYSYPEPSAPTAEDKAFLGWYQSGNFNDIKQRVDFSKKLSESFTMYPKFADAKDYTISNDGVLAKILDKKEAILEVPYNVNQIAVKKIWSGGGRLNILGVGYNATVTQVYLPSKGLKELRRYAFHGFRVLTSITIPKPVTVIEHSVFENTDALASVTLPEGLVFIWDSAFSKTKLTSITIPSTVARIGTTAFSENPNLKSVRVEAPSPPSMDPIFAGEPGWNQFAITHKDLAITVPPGKAKGKATTILEDYKAADGWSQLKITAYTE